MSSSDKVDILDTETQVPQAIDQEHGVTEQRPWYRVPHFRKLNLAVLLITLTSTTNGFDGSLLNGLQSLEHWSPYMGHPKGQVLGALSNGTTFGTILVFAIAPWFSDRFGRRFAIILGQSLVIIGSILQGLSTNYAFFLCSRIVIGCGGGIATVGSPTLISEIAFPSHRPTATTSYNICWYFGATIAAIVTYLTRLINNNHQWRIPSFLQGLGPVIQLLFVWLIPESPRYYVAKGKIDKAEAFLSKYHVGNSQHPKDKEFVRLELAEIEAALEAEKHAGANSRYSDFWTKKSYRKRLFLVIFTAVFMQLSGNGLVSYYLNKVLNSIGITSLTKQLQINMCLMIYNFVICVAVCAVVNKFKRRTMFNTSLIGMLLTYIIWTALSAVNQQRDFKDKSLGNGVLAMIFFYYLAYDIGANGVPYLYITEILPYSHRSKGINIFQVTMQIVLIYNGFVNPIAMDAIEWKYYIVYCCILAVECLIVFFFYPETSGRTLEEVANVFGDTVTPLQPHTDVLSIDKKADLEHVERIDSADSRL